MEIEMKRMSFAGPESFKHRDDYDAWIFEGAEEYYAKCHSLGMRLSDTSLSGLKEKIRATRYAPVTWLVYAKREGRGAFLEMLRTVVEQKESAS